MPKKKPNDIIAPLQNTQLQIIHKRVTSKYTIDEKLLAIGILDASRRDFNGVLTPEYSTIGAMLNIAESVLRKWYKDRDLIESQVASVIAYMPKSIVFTLVIEIRKIINELASRVPDMATRDLVNYFAQCVTKMRLLEGKSTANTAINVSYVPPSAPAIPIKAKN